MTRDNANQRRIELSKKYNVHSKTDPEKGMVIKGSAQTAEKQYTDDKKAIIYHYQQLQQVNTQLSNLETKKNVILEKYLLPFMYKRAAWMRHKSKTHQLYKQEQLQDLIELLPSKDEAYSFRKKYLSYKHQ